MSPWLALHRSACDGLALVARAGGSAWVFGLSMIILMPTVTLWLRKRLSG